MAISDVAYADGLRNLEAAVAAAPGQDLLVEFAFIIVTIVGDKA